MSMIKNIRCERLPFPVPVAPSDSFRLFITQDGVKTEVHRVEITQVRTITHWAVFEIGEGGLAYAIGDERLAGDLQALARAA